MDTSSKVANLIVAVGLTASPMSGKVIHLLPYVQLTAATVVVVNNSVQIADRFKPD